MPPPSLLFRAVTITQTPDDRGHSPPYLPTATSGWQRRQQPSPGNVHWILVWQCGRNVSERSHRPFLFPLRPPRPHAHRPKAQPPSVSSGFFLPPTHTGKQHNHSRPLQVQRHRRAQRCCQRQHYYLWWRWRYLGHWKRGGPGGFIAAAWEGEWKRGGPGGFIAAA